MVEREAEKFGGSVESTMSKDQREGFVWAFLGEIARNMADNQTEVADEAEISWAAESALPENLSEELQRIIINRAMAMAFLVNDERNRYRRFSHSELQNYFLVRETINMVQRKEIPKFMRRNVMGSDFLITFSDAVNQNNDRNDDVIKNFINSILLMLGDYRGIDRGNRNLSALLLACAPVMSLVGDIVLENHQIDDGIIRGNSSTLILRHCSINQIDIRDADIRDILFVDCQVAGLIVNKLTRVNNSLNPAFVQQEIQEGGRSQLVVDSNEIQDLIAELNGNSVAESRLPQSDASIENHPIRDLLEKVLRHRGHWIRENGDDMISAKIVSDVYWVDLKQMLGRHNFLREENRPAAGRASIFTHVRNANSLISKQGHDAEAFFRDMESFIRGRQASDIQT